ncbi:MAG TPA: ATP-binding protein, partial [Polyangiales bacterium]|nr:ATP-binding protein [Polyangiales bacterium]
FSVAGPNEQRWFVHVAISLLDTCTELGAKRPQGTAVHLVDVRGRFVCKPDALLHSADPSVARPVSGVRAGIRYERADGEAMLAAVARAPWGFQVIAEQSERDAFAASRQIRDESAFSIAAGALAAILAGLLLARGIHGPVQQLAHGAEQVARGEFNHRLPESGNDELAELSRTFNRMSQEIEKRDREIRAWNEELRQRVEQRTSELKQAQAALLESRKIAALASLGAGVAHEINNPLTGVIGLTQLLKSKLRDPKESELLGAVEREALRIRDIVQRMQVLSHVQEQRGYATLAPDALVDRLLEGKRAELEAASIALERPSSAPAARVRGNAGELEQALHELLDNALKAMRGRTGKLRIASELLEDELYKLSIADSGHGIAPENLERVFEPFFTTKSDWQGKGLGLTLAYRVIEAHAGTIRLQSALGEGTTVTITLPLARRDSHLA